MGVALGRMDRNDEAGKVLQTANAQDAKNPWAHRNLAEMLMKAAKPDEAISHYEAATDIQPNDQIAWLGVEDACRVTGRTKAAEEAYRFCDRDESRQRFRGKHNGKERGSRTD